MSRGGRRVPFKLFLEDVDAVGEVNFTPGGDPEIQFDLEVDGQPPGSSTP